MQTEFPGGSTTSAIAQTGTVPDTAASLRFYETGGISVSFAGHQLSLVLLNNFGSYGLYGSDISAYAGQTGSLQFLGNGSLDEISFSPQPIPEPGTCALILSGAVGLLVSRRKKQ